MKQQKSIIDEYKNHPDPAVRRRAENWGIGIGLQAVDGLTVSDFLIETAKLEIEGKITMKQASKRIENHYKKK